MEKETYREYMAWMFENYEEGGSVNSDFSFVICKLSMKLDPTITFTHYNPPDEISSDMEINHFPEAYKRLFDEYSTVCELKKEE